MFDSGASCNVVRPGLVKKMTQSGVTQVTRFDGSSTKARSIKNGVATIIFDRFEHPIYKSRNVRWALLMMPSWANRGLPGSNRKLIGVLMQFHFRISACLRQTKVWIQVAKLMWKLPQWTSNAKSRTRNTMKYIA